MELLGLSSLAGCTGMDVIDILRKKTPGYNRLRSARGMATARNTHPRVFTHMVVEYVVQAGHHVEPAAGGKVRVELSLTKYCSVFVDVE